MADAAAGTAAAVGATGYRLIVPDDWFSIKLETGSAERAIARLADRQFAGIDNAPHLKAQARKELLAQAEAARKAGGLEMFLSLMQVAGIPLAASLTTYVVPPSGGAVNADDLAPALAHDGDQVTVVDLPAGRAVRIVRDAVPPARWTGGTGAGQAAGDAAEQALVSREVQVFVPVPGARSWLLLAFAAPLGPLAHAMTELFDGVSQTLRWSQ